MKKPEIKIDFTEEKNYPLLFCSIVLAGMGLFFVFSYVVRRYLLLEYPYGDFLFYRHDVFMDFFNVNYMSEGLNPYLGYTSSYPPFILLISYLLTLILPKHLYSLNMSMTTPGRIMYLGFFGLVTILFMAVIWHCLWKRGKTNSFLTNAMVVICCIFNAPYILCLDRGNYLILAIVAYLLFFYYYNKNDNLAVLFLSIAIAIKIYPALVLLLFLIDKKYKKLFQCIFITGFLSLFPLIFFKGGIINNIIAFVQAVLGFGGGYEYEYMNIYFCTGLNSFFRLIRRMVFGETGGEGIFSLLYVVFAVLIFIISTVLLLKEKREYIRCLLLTMLIVFLPPMSYEYNLIYMLVPIVCLLVAEEKDKTSFVLCVLLSVLLIPKSYIWLYGLPDCISISVLLNPMLIFLILGWCVYEKRSEIFRVGGQNEASVDL